MGSSAQDQKTQTAASTAAQATSATQTANAAAAQNNSNNINQSLWATYDPTTNSYSGGSESAYLDPSKLTQTGLSGTYLNQYNNASNKLATDTQNAVGTTMQGLASRGLGATPAGFAADQQRKAYQDQAATQGNLYTNAAGQQLSDAQTNYWNATNNFGNAANTAQAAATQNNANAAGTDTSLYGTASQQKQSGWGSVLGAAAGLAGAGASAYKTAKG